MSSELRVDKIIPTGGVPTGGGGGVIQVVQKLFTTTFTSSVYAYTDVTGFTIDITPKFSTSKILCFGHISGNGTNNTRALYRLFRTVSGASGVQIGVGNDSIGNRAPCIGTIYTTDNESPVTFGYSVLDSPATTSATTYKVQGTLTGSGTLAINRRQADTAFGTVSNITLMEIAQ